MQRRFDAILSDLAARCPAIMEKPVLLAVSGGIDSMCMAELFLHSLTFTDFAVAHCNFHLRGDESDSDEALVRGWAERNGKKFFCKDFDTASYAKSEGLSIEMAARELRYRWFASLVEEEGFSSVAVAHNANDNVETLMLNLLRGTGIRGITGMKPLSSVPHASSSVALVRPMLKFTRRQIEGFVRARGIVFHEDSTNTATEYRRNRLRNLVFPVFGTINPSFVKTVSREMEYFAQACDIADDYFREHSSAFVSYGVSVAAGVGAEPDAGCRIDVPALMADPHWKYLLYRVLEPYGFNSASVGSVCSILSVSDTVGGKAVYSDGYELLTSSSHIVVRKRQAQSMPARPAQACFNTVRQAVHGHLAQDSLSASSPVMTIRGAGTYCFNGVTFSVECMKWDGSMPVKVPEGVQIFDMAKIGFPFICRGWMAGDWMRPLGMKGRKKVSDIFTDLKYGLPEKESAVVFVSPPASGKDAEGPEHHVSAILGVRTDESVKVSVSTENIIVIKTGRNLQPPE